MEREEAIKIIRKMLACTDLTVRANLNADMVSACNLAIKALEQQPILDKVKQAREEINAQCGRKRLDDYDYCSGLIFARNVLDKLIESEGG